MAQEGHSPVLIFNSPVLIFQNWTVNKLKLDCENKTGLWKIKTGLWPS